MNKIIPNYKSLNSRLKEERTYFKKLYTKLQKHLSEHEMELLKHYLKSYNSLVDAAKEISFCSDIILRQIAEAKKAINEDMDNMFGIDFSDEEKEQILYVFDIPIINDGKINW